MVARPGLSAHATSGGNDVGRIASDTVIARARWAGAALTLLQIALYTPPDGVVVPYSLWWALVPAGMLVTVNGLTAFGTRTGVPASRWRLVGLVGDSSATLLLIACFAFDPSSALWTLLMFPVAEAALRGWPGRAIVVFVVLSLGFVALRQVASTVWATPSLAIDSMTYRLGIVGIMAVVLSGLSRRLQLQIASTAASQAEADQLRAVATAARLMSELDVATVNREVTRAAEGMGFTGVRLWSRGTGAGGVSDPLAVGSPLTAQDFDHVAERTRRRGWVVFEGDAAPVPLAAGEALVVAGVTAGGVVGTLLAARHPSPVGEREADGLALVAIQASAALSNASRFEESRAFEAQLAHQATHDALTGLPNRTLFGERGRVVLAEQVLAGGVVGVLFLDLDRFKPVNDVLGHATGDELLRQVAARISGLLRGQDICARVGGDEFVVVSGGHAGDHTLIVLAERLRTAIHDPFLVDGLTLDVEVSIGIACSPRDGTDIDALLQNADVAMYHAKSARSGIANYADVHDRVTAAHLSVLGDLRRALEDTSQLTVHYQPVVDLAAGCTIGVEALVRWNHPVRGLILPSAFIPVAEGTSLIHQLTDHVLGSALAALVGWTEAGHRIRLSVNLSPRALLDPSVVERIARLLAEHGVPAEQLCLEITEETLLEDPTRAIAALHELKELGVRLSIDDFGTGYSSMSYLKRLPVDEIKIDRGFVTDMLDSAQDHSLVHAVVDLAHRLDLHVVAEGVENEAVLDALRQIGCEMAQGFYLGRPAPAEEITVVLGRRWPSSPGPSASA